MLQNTSNLHQLNNLIILQYFPDKEDKQYFFIYKQCDAISKLL